MTKEEILSDVYGELGDPHRELTSKPYSAVMQAMDEYAKQQAIAFMKSEDVKVSELAPDKTYEYLYAQFIEQQNKQP